ncbi:hypothetical protein ACR82Z_03210 [Mycoplasma sp. 6243]|uniref:hypothetical protein n=1 Tax=Mycoplasma sp. 6243 TaxID=3440865 RepID=UPI003EBC4F9B
MKDIYSILILLLIVVFSFKFIKDTFDVRKYYINNVIYKTTKSWMLYNWIILLFFAIMTFIFLTLFSTKVILIKSYTEKQQEEIINIIWYKTWIIWVYIGLFLIYLSLISFNIYFYIKTKVNMHISDQEFSSFDKNRINDFSVENSYLIKRKKQRSGVIEQQIRFQDYISVARLNRWFGKKLFYKSIVNRCLYFYLRQPQKLTAKGQQFKDTNEALLVLIHAAVRFINNISIKKIGINELWNITKNLIN